MALNINNSRAPARLAAAKKQAAEWAARYIADAFHANWRNNRTKSAALFGGPVWCGKATLSYVATESGVLDGLRSVGYSDEFLSYIRHKGYFADSFQDEVYRGQVWQLPARNGEPRYICGYVEENSGTVILSASNGRIDVTSEKYDAASWADSLAEKMAEWNRESDEAEQARYQASEHMSEYRADYAQAAKGYRDQLCLGATSYVINMLESKLEEKRDGFKKSLSELMKAKRRALDVERYYSVK